MQRRNTKQRRQYIVNAVLQFGQVSVQQLSEQTQTSEVTIRKDLSVLADEGLLLRRFGGAQALSDHAELHSASEIAKIKNTIKGDDSHRTVAIAPEISLAKQLIAAKAASLVSEQDCIIVDNGSTTAAMVPCLKEVSNVRVMTNSLSIAQQVTQLLPAANLLLTGGTWDKASQSFQGQVAEQSILAYDFDWLFIGADSIDVNRGSTTFNELTQLSQTMAKAAKQVVLLVEQKKVGRKMPNLELAWQDIDMLITDANLLPEDEQRIKQAGVTVLYANK